MSEPKDRSRERATPGAADPFAWWRDWLVQSERQWNKALNDMMGTDQFAGTMGRWMEMYLGVQKNINETLGRALTGMNVPNRDDVADLGLRLSAIEERLARIETLIERGTGVSDATAERRRPPRTRQPPGAAKPSGDAKPAALGASSTEPDRSGSHS